MDAKGSINHNSKLWIMKYGSYQCLAVREYDEDYGMYVYSYVSGSKLEVILDTQTCCYYISICNKAIRKDGIDYIYDVDFIPVDQEKIDAFYRTLV